MAKKLKNLTISVHRGARPLYPWDQWLDGSAWELTKGVDFQSSIPGFIATAHQAALRRRVLVKTQRKSNTVYLQAFTVS